MIYELIVGELVCDGAFFYNEDFGFYFFTEPLDYNLSSMKECNLRVNDKIANVVYDKTNSFSVYKIEHKDKLVYGFALKGDFDKSSVEYLTMNDLSINSDFRLFTGGDVLEYLAGICSLPNGNFVVGSVQDYISAIEAIISKYPNMDHFFRGHYHYKYLLVPSLYRQKKYYDNESFMYMDFKTQFYNELSSKKYIEILTTMQHYKMPTRLLDTTSNPLVALYMACDRTAVNTSKLYGVGEVVIMNEDRKDVKYSDSNATTLVSSLAVLETNYKQELYEKINEAIEKNDPSIYKNTIAYRRFVAEIQNELPYFDESLFTPEVLLKPLHVKVGMINDRIIAQSGSFILFGLCNYKTGEYQRLKTITNQRVFIVKRDNITRQLELLNINQGTMYPDKDHMSVSITKSYSE